MGNLADMQSALVDYIEMVGMSGYAQAESSETILGSFSSMKAAASDFATSLIDENADVGESWRKLTDSTGVFLDNIKPKIVDFLSSISPMATVVAGITSAFVAFRTAASISALLSTLVTSFSAYQKANEGATIAQWAMNAAMNANPFVLVATLVAGLVAAIVTLWHTNEDFRDSVIGVWNNVKSAATNIFTSVANFFVKTIPNAFNSVIDWFYGIKKRFVDIGQNIIAGIKHGISNAWRNLKTWFKGLFGDLIGIAKRILGIASPSKVFKKFGAFTAEGFGIGFEDEFEKVKKLVDEDMSFDPPEIKSARYSNQRNAGSGGFGFGNISIVVNGARYRDENELAEAIAEKIQSMAERRAAAYA